MAEGVPNLPTDNQDSAFANLLRAFAHRNYRLFFGGQFISLIGTFLTQYATAWFIYFLTKSTVEMGVVTFAAQIPLFVLSPFAGVWADRVYRRRMLVITQTLSMLESFGLAWVSWHYHHYTIHGVVLAFIGLNLFQGLVNAFDMPCRQAFLVEMIERREDLANAIALNSTMVHGARVLGPFLAGVFIYFVGPTLCFSIDGLSYLAVIAALLAMVLKRRQIKPPRSVWTELREGFSYVWNFAPIRALLLLMALLSLTGMPAISLLLPVFAVHFSSLGKSSLIYGLLGGASGAGALVGAIYLASRRSVVGLGQVIAIAAVMFGVSTIAFAFSPWLWASLLIMSFFTMAFIGMTPFGTLLAGYLAEWLRGPHGSAEVGAVRTLILEGVISVIAALLFARKLPALRKVVRPIYVMKGILPQETASGIQSSEEVVPAAK
jgi:MFS family permease